jgi:uncharacterized membrane protein YebE (DUF533 family)
MFDPKNLLDQFLGPDAASKLQQAGNSAKQQLDGMGLGGFGGGALAGGLLGALLGGKKLRKMAKGAVGYGGAAVVGAMAYKAYENWQQGKAAAAAPATTQADLGHIDQRFLPGTAPAADGQPFQLLLIKAMIGAAKADGHIDAQEQNVLFEQVEKLGLDAESKAFVFDALTQPADIAGIAAAVNGVEQATEVYLISRIAIDVDQAAERAYLQALAHKLKLPAELVAHLDHQVEAGINPDNA